MLILVLDDEEALLSAAQRVISEAVPEAEIMPFGNPVNALKEIKDRQLVPDIAFTDIEMPGMSGLDFAVQLKSISPGTRIVFVTAYVQYAYDAFQVRAQGYILKPLEVEQVRRELAEIHQLSEEEPLQIQCFGYFEVFWKGYPLNFARNRTKEMFAYLIDRRGSWCSMDEIITALWPEDTEIRKARNYLRILTNDLTSTLNRIGQVDILLRRRGQWAVDCSRLSCDYYQMLIGDVRAVNAFKGRYMAQYSWAEMTTGRLYFQNRGV